MTKSILSLKMAWYKDNWRHSLARKGVRTSFVQNSKKGWRSNPQDLVWDPKDGKYKDWRKVAAAKGLETGDKRRDAKVGDTPDLFTGINVYEGQKRESDFSSFEAPGATLSDDGSSTLPSQEPMLTSEQQAQPVEDALPPSGETPPLPTDDEEKDKTVSAAGFLPERIELSSAVESAPRASFARKSMAEKVPKIDIKKILDPFEAEKAGAKADTDFSKLSPKDAKMSGHDLLEKATQKGYELEDL